MRNSTAFDCHVFVSSEDRWFMVFDVMRMISTQIRRQDPCWSLPSCENIVWNVWEVAPPPHPWSQTFQDIARFERFTDHGRNSFSQNFRKFRSKTQWIGSVQPEKFRKNWSTFWGGPLFPVGPVGKFGWMDRAPKLGNGCFTNFIR